MVYNIITLPVTILFITCGVILLFYAIKLRSKYHEEHNFYNSILTVILWIIAGLIYPFFFWSNQGNFTWYLTLSTFFICILMPCLIFLIIFYQYRFILRNNPDLQLERNIETFLKVFDEKQNRIKGGRSCDLKTDLHRKGLHLIPAGIIILLWIFAVYVWEGIWKVNDIWGISGIYFGRFLILTAGYSGILIFGALDMVRLSFIFENRNIFHLIPGKVLISLSKSMKRKENFEFIKPVTLALSFALIFSFPISIFASAALISTIGDGAASIIGLRFGKKHFPKSSDKTIIGYIAGFLASFGISIFALWLFESVLGLYKILIIGISGATMFVFIDLLNLNIDDNILNPLLCAGVMGFLFIFL